MPINYKDTARKSVTNNQHRVESKSAFLRQHGNASTLQQDIKSGRWNGAGRCKANPQAGLATSPNSERNKALQLPQYDFLSRHSNLEGHTDYEKTSTENCENGRGQYSNSFKTNKIRSKRK